MNPAQSRPLAGDVLQRKIRVDRVEVDVTVYARKLQQRLQLGSERKRPIGQARPHERLLAEPVTCEDEPLARSVPERKREHPAQPRDEVRSILLVEMRQDR